MEKEDMSEELDFSLPQRETPRDRHRRSRNGLLWLILVVGVANIVLLWTGVPGRKQGGGAAGGLDPDARKELALKLETQGLHDVAAQAWKDYLKAAGLKDEEAARIWYRIGVVYQDGEDYQRALDAFYRSEQLAKLRGLDLEIARRTQECLETMGKFAALRHALDERVGIGANTGQRASEVVAEIGATKITQAELDQRIEEALDGQLARMAPNLSEEQRKERKEELLKQFASPSQRLQFLNQFLFEELLYREARDSDLAAKPEVRRMLRDQERSLLAANVIQRDVLSQIQITPADVETYYNAHLSDYMAKDKEGAETQKSLDEVRNEIYQVLRDQREQALQQRLFATLMSKYDGVIHHSLFGSKEAETND